LAVKIVAYSLSWQERVRERCCVDRFSTVHHSEYTYLLPKNKKNPERDF